MKIYAISGLGADKRVFNFLTLGYEIIALDWIEPKEKESIIDYSKRLSKSINTNEDFIILGVSFGGLVAIEISKILNPKRTIIISSVETKNELSPFLKLYGRTQINKALPISFFNSPKKMAHFLFGTKHKELLNNILDDTDLKFAKWATTELINWQNTTKINNLLKICGSNDKLLPPKNIGNCRLVEKGEHLMIVDRADEISRIINDYLKLILPSFYNFYILLNFNIKNYPYICFLMKWQKP